MVNAAHSHQYFFRFIYDLPAYVKCFLNIYVDDIKLYFTAHPLTDCDLIQKWP